MELEQIYEGMKVIYCPSHTKGNLYHKDTEKGVVTEVRGEYIFVRFGGDTESKACQARDLR